MPKQWKGIRITVEAWRRAKKVIAGEDVDLDDFLSYIIEMCKIDEFLSNYLDLPSDEDEDDVS